MPRPRTARRRPDTAPGTRRPPPQADSALPPRPASGPSRATARDRAPPPERPPAPAAVRRACRGSDAGARADRRTPGPPRPGHRQCGARRDPSRARSPIVIAVPAIELQIRLKELQAERLLASSAGLGTDRAYMADLEDEIAEV